MLVTRSTKVTSIKNIFNTVFEIIYIDKNFYPNAQRFQF